MSKTCKNCDYFKACVSWTAYNEEDMPNYADTCKDWSGWHDTKEELPKVGEEVLVYCKNRKNALFSMNENKFWKTDIGNAATDYVIAWRELPEYEAE